MTNDDVRAIIQDIIHRVDSNGSDLTELLDDRAPALPADLLAKQIGAQIAVYISSIDKIQYVDFFARWNDEERTMFGKYEVVTDTLLISTPFEIPERSAATNVTATATVRRRSDITEVRVSGARYPLGSTEPWLGGVTVTVAGVGWEIELPAQRLGGTELGRLTPHLLG